MPGALRLPGLDVTYANTVIVTYVDDSYLTK